MSAPTDKVSQETTLRTCRRLPAASGVRPSGTSRRPSAWFVLLVLAWLAHGTALEASGAELAPAGTGGGNFRALAVPPLLNRPAGFTVVPATESGVLFTNRLATARYVTNQIHLNGSGVALGDVNGDGWCDVFLAGLDGPNALYLNLGAARFTNVTAASGLDFPGVDVTGVALADLDGDGDLDVALNTIGTGTHLLANDGGGRFAPFPGSPFNRGRGGTSLAVGDIEGDGDLDLFVGNYRTDTFRDQPGTRFRGRNVQGRMILQTVNGQPVTEPHLVGRYSIDAAGGVEEHGEADALLVNDGAGRFTESPMTGGHFLESDGKPISEPPYDWTLSVAFRDLNGDRAPDLYVCNDFSSPDEVWLNDGRGRFRRSPALALRHQPLFSMGVDFADLNGDGQDDFIVADMLGRTPQGRQTQIGGLRPQFAPQGVITNRPQYPYNHLYLSRGDGTYAETAWNAGVSATDWTWCPVFLDVDLDGLEDLLFATGHELDMMDADIGAEAERRRRSQALSTLEVQRLKLLFPRHAIPNVALRNQGSRGFTDATDSWGFGIRGVSTGIAAGDLDNDGDLDLVLNNLNDGAIILRNDTPAPRLLVRLRGQPPNTRGIGAKIRVEGGPSPQMQEVMGGGRYLSSDDPARVFATGDARELRVEVRWRSGSVTRLEKVAPNQVLEISEPPTGSTPSTFAPAQAAGASPLFTNVSAALRHVHVDASHDDFATQPLLPHRLSQLGPGVAWHDVDGDGAEDLILGSGRGGQAVVRWNRSGQFQAGVALPDATLDRDVMGILPWPSPGAATRVLMALANWEDAATNSAAVALTATTAGPSSFETILPASLNSPGAMAAADFDGDGDLDVFVGSRAVPLRYPEAPKSILLENDAGRLKVATAAAPLPSGMVAGATWADLEGDGFPELITACEWGSVQILRNRAETLTPWRATLRIDTPETLRLRNRKVTTLDALTGCWSGIAPVDLDEDGRLDLIVGNWGLNSRWELHPEQGLRLYFNDLDENGTLEIIEAALDPGLGSHAPLRTLDRLTAAMPFVRAITPTYKAYSRATVADLLGARMASTPYVEAVTLSSVALLNRGDHFVVTALPEEAQRAPVFAVVPADFDGDGHFDVFLSQNFFAVHGDAARQDAGRGLLLLGDGEGRLQPSSGDRSGIAIDGEQRGAAAADYDADGRMDLVVSQNSAATQLLHNQGAKPGLRVRLRGPAGNAAGIGALVRLRMASGLGPGVSVDGGSGWLSQNSSTLVFGVPSQPTHVVVRWPGGKLTETPVGTGLLEATVAWEDSVR